MKVLLILPLILILLGCGKKGPPLPPEGANKEIRRYGCTSSTIKETASLQKRYL